jgi:hypothetical protein
VRTKAGNGSRKARAVERAMGQARTYGFGRVSPTVTPSPYSPLHRPSEIPGSSPAVRDKPRRASRGRRLVAAIVLGLLAIASVSGVVVVLGRAPAAPVAAKPAATAPVADDETLRLPRSAIAVHRNTPRPRS